MKTEGSDAAQKPFAATTPRQVIWRCHVLAGGLGLEAPGL